MNSFIQAFRENYPNYPGSDDDLTLQYGDLYPPDQYEYPEDFISDYQKLKTSRDVSASSVYEEAKAGFGRGVKGLEAAAAGGVALASDYLGLEEPKKWGLAQFQRLSQESAEQYPASVPTIQQASQSLSAAGQYVAGKVGELIPNIAEAMVGAGVGTVLAPGPGTVAGAAPGFILRGAAKAAIKKEVEFSLKNTAQRALVKKELEDFAEGKIQDKALNAATQKIIQRMSQIRGAEAASIANFAALGAGGGYGSLSGTPGVSGEAARTGALIAGAGASIGAMIPTRILKGIFGESVGEPAARSYVDLYARKIPTELLTAGSGMGAMEFFNVVAEHYADPAKREQEFSKEDYSRILNAAATGIIAGLPAGGISALRGVKTGKVETKAKEAVAKEPEKPIPPAAGEGIAGNYPVPPEALPGLRLMAEGELSGKINPEEVELFLAKNPGYRPRYQQIKAEVQNASRLREDAGQVPPGGAVAAGGKVESGADLERGPSGQPGDTGAPAEATAAATTAAAPSAPDVSVTPLSKAAADLSEENKAALKLAGVDPDTLGLRSAGPAPFGVTEVDLAIQRARAARAKATEEPKPAPATPKQAPEPQAPAAATVSSAKPGGVAAPTEPPAISQPTTKVEPPQADESKATKTQGSPPVESVPAGGKGKTEAPPSAELSETSWLSNVVNKISAWRTPRAGKEEADMYSDLGRDPKNKNKTRALGVFKTQDGEKIIVASLYDNNGRKVFMGKKGQAYGRATSFFMDPIGYIKTVEAQEKFYREYTPEQWAEIQKQLEAKRDAAKAEIGPEPEPVSKAAAAEAQVKPVGLASGLEEKPVPLTAEDATRIHNLVTEHVGGLPKSEDVKEIVGDALSADQALTKRLAKAAGEDYYNFVSILDQIYSVYDKAAQSGETDPAKLRATITKELAAIRPEVSPAGEAPPEVPGSGLPKQAEPGQEHLLGVEDLRPDEIRGPEFQEKARGILSRFSGAGRGHAYNALVEMYRNGMFRKGIAADIAAELIKLGDKGINLVVGGEYFSRRLGKNAAGRYDYDTDTVHVLDAAFSHNMSARGFLHEYVHGLTHAAIESGLHSAELNELFRHASVKAEREGKGFYGLSREGAGWPGRAPANLHEFVAEAFTNRQFQEFLNRTRSPIDSPQTLWERFVSWVGKLLGIKSRSALADVLRIGGELAATRQTIAELEYIGGPRVQVPSSSRTIQWQTPSSGYADTIETYNARTGRIESAPVVVDSVEAALHNVNRQGLEFLLPAGSVPFPERDPAVDHTNQHAILNKLLEVLGRGVTDAGANGRQVLSMFGLTNAQTAKERLAFEESVKGLQHVERDKTFESIHWAQNKDEVAVGILGALEKNRSKIAKVVATAKEELPEFERRHQEKITEATDTINNLEDATEFSNVLKKGVDSIINASIRSHDKLGQQLGLAEQMYRDIEEKLGRPIDPNVVNVFRRLSTSEALHGEKLFDIMNQMANDPSIDFSQKASDIRSYIRHAADMGVSHLYTMLAGDAPEDKALLSAAIAYGKLNRRIMTLLQVRRMDGPDRVALKQELQDQFKETTGQLKGGVRVVAKSSALVERARAENRELLRQITEAKRDVEQAQSRIYIGEKLLPHYLAEIDRITPKVSQTEDTVFGDGMVLRIPKTNDPNPKWEELKVNLKVSSGNPTTVAQIKSAFDRMLEWTALRDLAYIGGDDLAHGLDYQRVRQQLQAITKQKIHDPVIRSTDQTLVGLFMGSSAKQMGALGTPVGKLIETGVNKYAGDTTNLRTQSDREFGYKNQRLWNNVLSVLNRERKWYQRSKVNGEWFSENIFDKALGFLERGQVGEWEEIGAARNAWFQKMGQWLLTHENIRPLIEDRMPEFMGAMRELADSIALSGGWWIRKNVEAGMLVKDPSLGGRLRRHIDQGLWTFQRKFAKQFFSTVHAFRESGWDKDEQRGEVGAYEAFQNIANLLVQDPAKAEALVQKYTGHQTYGDTVQKAIYSLAHVPDGSVFRTPALDDTGTKIPAGAAEVARACDQANGNLIQMFKLLHDHYNGQDAQANYIQDELVNLASVFHKLDAALKKVEPQDPTKITTFVGMVPSAMIDARELKDLPPEWFTYHRFDQNDNARIAERTAWQTNFGREGRELANWHKTAKEEADAAVDLFNIVEQQAKEATPSGRRKDIKAAMARILAQDTTPILAGFKTGEERLKYLKNQKNRYRFIQSFLTDMAAYHARGSDSSTSLRWGIRMAHEMASLLVNQPSSAIAQLATTVDIMMQWGLSPTTIKATAKTIQMTAKDIAGSLAQAVGWEFLKPSYYEGRGLEMGLFSSVVARRMGDIFTTLTGEETNRGAKAWRLARDIQGAAVNLRGESAKYTPLQPMSPFFQFVTSANRGLFVSLAEMADRYVRKGVEFLRSNPGSDRITADNLGLNRFEKNTFEIWQKDHARYGLDFTEMVRGAKERLDRGDQTILTDRELARINSVGLSVISLENNIATMPLWAFNNSLVQFGLPLLGWSYRRAGQVASLRLNTKDKASLYAVSNALMGVAATGLGGLGISLLVDAYSEDILGKKRNIRSLKGLPVTGNDWQGIEERLAKVGTFGLWGELANLAVNVGTGQGDNRMLSVDQRVVAMQSFQSIGKAISAYINQGFDADYKNVVRPMVASLGGNGALQYMQIISHAFDLDNVESRVVKRINAENYLRVTGRELGISIRTGGGAYNTPTPITPWIARMEYAAYANDPEDFRAAYNGAKAEARAAGKEDPESYVKQAFATRHPLRYVYAQVPSQREYRQILANLDDRGRESVTEAIRLFNYYGAHLGLAPFQGSEKKDQQRLNVAERAMNARLRAIGVTP